MTIQIAHLHATLCIGIVFFHLALIFGAPWGNWALVGHSDGALSAGARMAAALSVPVLLLMALAIVSAAGFPLGWPRWTGWAALAGQGASAGVSLFARSTAERRLWGPLGLVMTAMALVVMTG